jgi:hypothetical protein
MIIIVGLIILVVAAIAGVAAVLGNAGHGHALTSGFSMLGYHVTGSTGALFLYGIVVGAVAMLGLALLVGGARRSSRRGIAARRSLRQSRRETTAVSQDRDDLIGQRDEAARARAADTSAASTPAAGTSAYGALAEGTPADTTTGPDPVRPGTAGNGPGSWLRGLGRRLSPQQAPLQPAAPVQASPVPESLPEPETETETADHPASEIPAGDPASV